MNDSRKTAAIEVADITKRFGAVVALDRVSVSVSPGELFFLLGPSGCGKTTLLRILAGLETPDTGAIRFDGQDVLDRPPHLRGAPMVFQNYSLWPHLSVAENVAFGLVERGIRRAEIAARTAEALQLVGLEGLGARMPGQLSGGQQQRVALARTLVLQPRVVLLDEPLSNLDAKLRAEMREEIERLHARSDITFIYVTHDQIEALSLADRMAVLHQGRVSALGVPRALYHRPPNRFCAEFLGEANLIEGRLTGLEGEAGLVETAFGQWRCAAPLGAALRTGQSVHCLIRPENLRMAGAAGNIREPLNRLTASVRRARLNGGTVTVLLQAGEQELKATLLNDCDVSLATGQTVEWGARSADTVLLCE
jgi:iron(III) transport system ATP-binding protein